MVKSMFAALILMLAAAAPALAQDTAECRSIFRTADLNEDGVLSSAEIAASDEAANVVGEDADVTLTDFVSECQS